jgi:alkanesulfonate monooxygenase SsuD/methylene tetrahydromethanopterin reductase-like flavin-dependent oxidoreductase (luciferase family)
MKFGLAVTGRANPKIIEKLAIKAEELGYDSILITDHFMLSSGNNHIDVWSFLPYLAAKTERIRLGTCVTPIPLRQPAIFAKSVSSVDNLSKGRVIIGAGFGWYQPEFEGYSKWLETKERIAYSEEAIRLMIKLWTATGPIDFAGSFINLKQTVLDPKPVQKPHPQIWFGGHLSQSLRMAATYGQGWMPIGPRWFDESYPKPSEYALMKRDIVSKLASSPSDFVFTSLINMTELSTLRKDVDDYINAGMNYFTLGHKAQSEDSLKDIETVAKEIGRSL